ncbi:hypothetical protein FBR05_02230 [Deltaproteobacteria bacterium PRO3]|nr:hypothetical protein [Deltaproteobacteria bacterium PRO3]
MSLPRLRSSLIFLFILVTCIAWGLPRAASAASDLEAQAELRLRTHLKKQLPPRGLSLDCVDLFLEASTPKYYEYAVRERHGGKCGGDPEVAPIVDRFRVPKRGGKILKYDPVEDRWLVTAGARAHSSPPQV